MFIIIPTEIGLDKNRLPWLTIAMAMTLIIVYALFQLDDQNKDIKLFEFYEDSELKRIELPYFKQYLETVARKTDYPNPNLILSNESDTSFHMMFDRAFRRWIPQQIPQTNNDYAYWQVLDAELKRKLSDITYYQYGAKPDQLDITRLITHAFLHGGIGHLLGNLLFLVIFGAGVERLFGKVRWLVIYFASAMAGAYVFSTISTQPFVTLIGASGAISGLMGAYAASFGMKRIRFFAWLGLYFNHFRLPALFILLYWIIQELLSQLLSGNSGIAYMAHFGGLLTGGVIAGLFRLLQPIAQSQPINQPTMSHYAKALEHLKKLDFEPARIALHQELQTNPDNLEALKTLYNIDKNKPNSTHYQQTVQRLFAIPASISGIDAFIMDVANESLNNQMKISHLSVDSLFSLAQRLLRNDRLEKATPLVEFAKKHHANNLQLPELLWSWSDALVVRGKNRKARDELIYLANYYAETALGQRAQKRLAKQG